MFAPSPQEVFCDICVLPSTRPSVAEPIERDDLLRLGDRELITQLLAIVQTPVGQSPPLASTPVSVSELSLLGQWGEVFHAAFNHSDFTAWADRQQLDFSTLQVRNGVLEGRQHHPPTLQRYTLADESGWWKVANPIIYIAQLLDPAEFGLPYIGDRVENRARTLSLDRVLAFYGYPLPVNRLQAHVIVEELSAANAFPAINSLGQNRSLLHAERLNQQLDFHQLADALQALASPHASALPLTRLQLRSGSLLARTLKEAAQHLQAVLNDNENEPVLAASGNYYFDQRKRAIVARPPLTEGQTEGDELRPENPDSRWLTLGRLAANVGIDIYPDHSLHLAACLQAYGIEPATTATEHAALITRLRQWPMPAAPTLLAAARSLDERYRQSRYIGVLNDRHALRRALYRIVMTGELNGPQGLDAMIEIDPETLLAQLLPAVLQLRALVEQPEFATILEQQQIDPKSHVLLSVKNGLGAHDVNGIWKSLSAAVMANARLAPRVRNLLPEVTRSGGELRTNEQISLRQALQLYNIPWPTTLNAAHLIARSLTTTLLQPLNDGHYWRALTPANTSQPVGWTLSDADRQRVTAVSRDVLTGQGQHVFSYLSAPLLEGKSQGDIRAEADLLLIRLIASPRAQQLASRLEQAVQWQGSDTSEFSGHASRSALVWAALILSLDPNAGAPLGRVNGLDLTTAYFWGESVAFVRLQVESSFRGLTQGGATLAAHLLLCGQAPYLLVREVPDSLPFGCSQAWVSFQQYATYLEQRIPGGARQLSHDEIMYLVLLPPRPGWRLFLDSAEAIRPILGWARANGLLPSQEQYTTAHINVAVGALNALRTRLRAAQQLFTEPVPNRRNLAFEALKKVYPHASWLEELVWERSQEATPRIESSVFPAPLQQQKYSFIDLYIAEALVATSRHWIPSDSRIDYLQMAQRFVMLPPFSQMLVHAFDAHMQQLKTAYVDYLQSALPSLPLRRREALEFGNVEFFALRQGDGPVGVFGLIVCASFYRDRHVYECFPKYLLIRPRRDLDYSALVAAAESGSQALPNLALEWPAYASGAEPAQGTPVAIWPGLRISKLESTLLEVESLPDADIDGNRIPRLDSPRSLALASIITERHYLQGSVQLRAQAAIVPTLEDLSRGDDAWADYFLSMTLAAK